MLVDDFLVIQKFHKLIKGRYDVVFRMMGNKIKYFGYIMINSQLDYRKMRAGDRPIKVALKEARVINEKSTKVIPVIDKSLWNELVRRYNVHTDDPKYTNPELNLLFPSLSKPYADRILRLAFNRSNIPFRSWHMCRHTRCTFVHGETYNSALAKIWLGHKKEQVHENYNHSYVAMVRDIKNKSAGKKTLKKYD